MRRLRILCLVPEGNIPPESLDDLSDKAFVEVKMEFHVIGALKELGHDVRIVDVTSNLGLIREAILDWKPHLAFNMLEDFHGVSVYDHHLVSYLELMRKPYTGCNPRGLMLARDKALAKKILTYHRIKVPRFAVFPLGKAIKRPRWLPFPLLVKSSIEESSTGISQASIVKGDDQLVERVQFIHDRIQTDAIAEEYIEGRELYVAVMGNQRLRTFPIWELLFENMPEGSARIATARVKFNLDYQKKYGISSGAAKGLPAGVEEKIVKLCKRVYRTLSLSGYARFDLRLSEDGTPYVLEAPGAGARLPGRVEDLAAAHLLRSTGCGRLQPVLELLASFSRIVTVAGNPAPPYTKIPTIESHDAFFRTGA
jgi:D-alanine-D-alanine ligase